MGCSPAGQGESEVTATRRALGADGTQLVAGPELAVDRPVAGTQNDMKYAITMASDGDRFLVAWVGDRYLVDGQMQNLYGALIEAGGQLHKPEIFAIGAIPGDQSVPVISWNGTDYLVLYVAPDPTGGSTLAVCGTRVDRNGKVLGSTNACLRDPETAATFGFMAVGWNGTNHLLAWKTNRGLFVTRITPTGEVLDPQGVLVYDPAGVGLDDVTVGSDGKDFLVAWTHDRRDISASRVSGEGKLLDATPIPVCADGAQEQAMGSIAWGKDSYLLSWGDARNNLDVYGGRMDRSGVLLDGGCGKPLLGVTGFQSSHRMLWNGQSYTVFWKDNQPVSGQPATVQLRATTLDETGTAVAPTGMVVMDNVPTTDLVIAWNGTSYYTLWGIDRTDGTYTKDWFGSRISGAFELQDQPPQAIAIGPWQELAPAIASNGQGYLVAWQDRRNDESDIVAARLDVNGATLDQDAIVLQTFRGRQEQVSVAWDGAAWVVAWVSPWSLSAPQGQGFAQYVRVSPEGAILDPGVVELPWFGVSVPIVVHPAQTDWALLIALGQVSGGIIGIRSARIGRDGKPMDATPTDVWLPPSGEGARRPKAACGDTECLLAWAFSPGNLLSNDLKGMRIDKQGKAIDAQPFVITQASGSQYETRLSWDGSHYLVAWGDLRSGDQEQLYGAIFGPDGKRGSTEDLLLVPKLDMFDAQFSLVWTGKHHLVAWETPSTDAGRDIYGIRIDQNGKAIDDAPQLLVGTRFDDKTPALAPGPSGNGRAWLAYSRFDDTPGVLIPRIKVRAVDIGYPPPDGGGADSAAPDVAIGLPDLAPPDARIPDAATAEPAIDAAPALAPDLAQDSAPDLAEDLAPVGAVDLAPESAPTSTDVAMFDSAPDRAPDPPAVEPRGVDATSPQPDAALAVDTALHLDSHPVDASIAAKTGASGCSCAVGDDKHGSAGGWSVLALTLLLPMLRRRKRERRQ